MSHLQTILENKVLNNITSHNVSQSTYIRKTKYFSKKLDEAKKSLQKKHKMKFKFMLHTNKDLDLPIMKHFPRSIPRYDFQIILYYKNSYKHYYDKLNGRNKFHKRLNEIYKIIEDEFENNMLNKPFEKKIHFDKDDRYTFVYGYNPSGYMFVQLKKLDLSHPNRQQNNRISLGPSVMKTIRPNDDKDDVIRQYIIDSKVKLNKMLFADADSNKLTPLSYLMLRNKKSSTMRSLHIEFGYTFKDSRGLSYSTVLRKLIQAYAYDKNLDLITTHAVTWGSQKGSKSAGMLQMPIVRKKQVSYTFFPNSVKKNMFKPKNSSRKSEAHERLRKAVYNSTRYTPQKQLNFLTQYYGGKIPLNAYGRGLNLNLYENENIYGTHVRKIKGRSNIINKMTF